MANLYVTEYSRVASADYGSGIQAGLEPPVTQQKVSFTSSTQSSAFNSDTRLIMVHTDANCHIEIAENPTATTNSRRLPAGSTVFYGIPNNLTLKIAALEE